MPGHIDPVSALADEVPADGDGMYTGGHEVPARADTMPARGDSVHSDAVPGGHGMPDQNDPVP